MDGWSCDVWSAAGDSMEDDSITKRSSSSLVHYAYTSWLGVDLVSRHLGESCVQLVRDVLVLLLLVCQLIW